MLVFVGICIAVFLFVKRRSYLRADGSLWYVTLAPLFLLFIDLSNDWRIICYLVIALVGITQWNSARVRYNVI